MASKNESEPDSVVETLSQESLYKLAKEHGFYPDDWNIGTALTGVHGEITEAYDAHRDGEGDNRVVSELADAVMRCFGIAEHLGVDIVDHIFRNHLSNKKRPYLHGKKHW